mgnify:CR=1 FL=1
MAKKFKTTGSIDECLIMAEKLKFVIKEHARSDFRDNLIFFENILSKMTEFKPSESYKALKALSTMSDLL